MMLLNVIAKTEEQAKDIAIDLLEAKLIAQAAIDVKNIYEVNNEHQLQSTTGFMLKGISKALLFETINKRLRLKYGNNTPVMFAEPLIYIDSHQNDVFLEKIVKV